MKTTPSPQMHRAIELVSAAYEEAMSSHGILPQARMVIRAAAEAALDDVLGEAATPDTADPPAPYRCRIERLS